MKQILFILTLFAPVLFWSCNDEKIEMLPPYVFFTHDVDYYVMDGDNPNPAPYQIKGTVSAEGYIETVQLGSETIGRDSIGDETRFYFTYDVDIKGKTPFDVPFKCVDRLGNFDEKVFHFLGSQPIETYSVTLGAQNNSNYGFYFSFTDRKTYSVAEFENKLDDDGFCYGFNPQSNTPLLVSPTELVKQVIINRTGTRVSSFCGIIAVNSVSFTKASFDAMTNDAFMRNLNGSEFGTYAFNQIEAGKAYLVKSSAGLRGIIYVTKIERGVAGSIELIIKLQKNPA
ncbi:MAG: hypothetical protein LBH19_10755 [Dysgonamonadaceae bacterium]|jgi:hypothetical protein|nr:hypothetical protein [Dysgonamonadaceae bacterium]